MLSHIAARDHNMFMANRYDELVDELVSDTFWSNDELVSDTFWSNDGWCQTILVK